MRRCTPTGGPRRSGPPRRVPGRPPPPRSAPPRWAARNRRPAGAVRASARRRAPSKSRTSSAVGSRGSFVGRTGRSPLTVAERVPLVHLGVAERVQRHRRVAGAARPAAQGHLLGHRAGREERRGLGAEQPGDPLAPGPRRPRRRRCPTVSSRSYTSPAAVQQRQPLPERWRGSRGAPARAARRARPRCAAHARSARRPPPSSVPCRRAPPCSSCPRSAPSAHAGSSPHRITGTRRRSRCARKPTACGQPVGRRNRSR